MTSNARWIAFALILTSLACARDAQLSTESKEAAAAYEAGLEEMRRFRMPNAVQNFDAAVAADSSFAMAYLELSRCYPWVGRADEVDAVLERAYALREGSSEAERLQIEHAYASNRRDYESAEAVYQQLLARYPHDAYTLQVTARHQWRDREFEAAASSYRRILEEDASRVDVHNLLGYLNLEAGDYEEAIQSFQRYVYYAPNLANPHDSLGDAYAATGQYDDAITQYWAALEIDPTFFHSWGQLAGVLIETGQFQQASSILDKTNDLFEELQQSPWRTLLRLRILLESENWAALADQAEAALQLPHMQTEAARNVALDASALRVIALLESDRIDAAEIARRDFDQRLQDLVKAEQGDDPKSLPDLVQLAQCGLDSRFARARQEPSAGIDALAAAVAKSKLSPHQLGRYRIELARARLAAGENEAALAEVQTLLSVIPTHPEANLQAAKILSQLGRSEDVLRHLGIYLEVMRRADPGHPGLREAQRLAERYAIAN